MKKAPNLPALFIPLSLFFGYAGALILRWHQLALLYRTIDQFFIGIGTTLAAVTFLAGIVSIFFIKFLSPMGKLAKRIEAGEKPTVEDQKLAGKTYNKIRICVFVENAIGFIIGQISVSVIDFVNKVYPFTPSRFTIIIFQAVCIGIIVSLYEIYFFDIMFLPYRNMLNIHSIETYGTQKVKPFAQKVIITAAVCFIFMGVNAFSTGYGLLHGDFVTKNTNLMKEYLTNGVICLILNFITCIGLVLIVCIEMRKRIRNVTGVIQELEKTGDLSRRINISIDDDIGLLTSSQNDFMDKLSETVEALKEQTGTVAGSSQILTQVSSKSLEAIEQMNRSVSVIDEEDKKTNEIINSTYNDIESLRDSAKQVENQVMNQNHAMERASASIEEMAGNITSIAETTKKADQVSEELRVTSEKGVKSIRAAEEAIALIQDSSAAVQEAVIMIKKISSQTNLLAMNASIEAAHAGEFGKGFAVVADEVRSLATTTSKNVEKVSSNIAEMEERIQKGVGAMQEAKTAFTSIDSGVAKTADIVREIAQSVEEQRLGTIESLDAAQDVVESIATIKELAVSQRQHTENVFENTKSIVNASNVITSSLEQTTAATRNLNSVLSDVNNCVEENSTAIQQMKTRIDAFKTE